MSTKFYIKDENGVFLSIDGVTRYTCLEGRAKSLSRTLKNEYEQDAEANTHRTVKGKLSDRSARTP